MSGNRSCDFLEDCLDRDVGRVTSSSFILAKVFFSLPLCLAVLLLCRRRWRRRSSSAAAGSQSDVFISQAAIMEVVSVVGVAILQCGQLSGSPAATRTGTYVSSAGFSGQVLLHCLTCSERYLAVLHPVAYRGLRRGGGVTARNASVGCVWLLSLGWMGVTHRYYPRLAYVPYVCLLGATLAAVSACSLAVLCALIRPGPGEVGGARRRAGQSKRRAFCMVTAITAALLLFFLGMLLAFFLAKVLPLTCPEQCALLLLGNWCNFPSSLVLPLLFLHRAGKLPRCRGSKAST